MVRDGAGTHFDPAIAAALVRLHERGELRPPGELVNS
jgi:HD-GYP domain-containing protein (c-di-GMP phosphodiesterase class II)